MSFNCAFCTSTFGQDYGSLSRAEQDRDQHQTNLHPAKLYCGQCGQSLRVNYNMDNGQQRAEAFMMQHQNNCSGFVCKFCGEEFKGMLFRGGFVVAERARNKHQQTHPKAYCCEHCGLEFDINGRSNGLAAPQLAKSVHEKNCSGLKCAHCAACFSLKSYGGSRAVKARDCHQFTHSVECSDSVEAGDEHAVLLAVTRLSSSFYSLIAWHCTFKKLFRPIGATAFWSISDFNSSNLVEGGLFRFQRHSNQLFSEEDWNPQGPHVRDNIRVCDISPLEGPWPQLYRKADSIQNLLYLKEDLYKADPPALNAEQAAKARYYSSFVLVLVQKLQFTQSDCEIRLRCSFIDAETKQRYHNVPVVNVNLASRIACPLAGPNDQLVVLGLSNRSSPELMFDAWVDDILSAKVCSEKAKLNSRKDV